MINDQHAVALQYHEDEDIAPRVIATGKGEVAEEILRIARENKVPVQNDSELVELLAQLDMDEVIPPELYHAVAAVLAFVYTLDNGNF